MSNKRFLIGVLALMIVFSAVLYPFLPEQVPVHWSIQGVPDSFAHKSIAVLLLPMLTLGIMLLSRLMMSLTAFREKYGEAHDTHSFIMNAIVLFFAFTHVVMLLLSLSPQSGMLRLFIVGVGILLAALGNVMGRLRPNPMFGFRFPWTLNDEVVWRRTHRVGGRWLFVSGLVIALAAWVLPLETTFLLVVVLILGGSLALAYMSRQLWLQRHSGA